MKPYIANTINGVVLVFLGLLGAKYAMDTFPNPSKSIYLAPLLGSFFLMLTPGIKNMNKTIGKIVAILSCLLFILLLGFPLRKILTDEVMNTEQLLRVATMSFSCLLATIVLGKQFLLNKKV